ARLSCHSESDGLSEVGVVYGVRGIGAEVLILEAEFAQKRFERLLHFETAVISSDRDSPRPSSAARLGYSLQNDVAFASEVSGKGRHQGLFRDTHRSANAHISHIFFGDQRPVGQVCHWQSDHIKW